MAETIAAPAKINLSLLLLGRRPDGYHELESLFVPVPGLHDDLDISAGPERSGCVVEPELPGTPPERNLVFRAWQAYAEATGFAPDVSVRLTKRIPTGAGLGGGSSDAAALLLWLQANAADLALDHAELNALAARLGADVPFFLLGAPALAQGIGEVLTPVELDLSGLTLVLALPDTHVSTAWAYARWDEQHPGQDAPQALQERLTSEGLTHKRRVSLSPVIARNDFESVVFPEFAELRRVKENLLALGAACAVMSGSGAGIAALFRESRLARHAADALRTSGLPVHHEALRHWGVAKR